MHTFVNRAFEAAAYTNMIAGARGIPYERRSREEIKHPTLVERLSLNAGRVTAGLLDIGVAAYCTKCVVEDSSNWANYIPLGLYVGSKVATNLITLTLRLLPIEELAN